MTAEPRPWLQRGISRAVSLLLAAPLALVLLIHPAAMLDAEGRDEGTPVLAIDPLGAGLHQRVILSTDGSATRELVRDPKTPLRNLIIGLVDS